MHNVLHVLPKSQYSKKSNQYRTSEKKIHPGYLLSLVSTDKTETAMFLIQYL